MGGCATVLDFHDVGDHALLSPEDDVNDEDDEVPGVDDATFNAAGGDSGCLVLICFVLFHFILFRFELFHFIRRWVDK